MTILESRKMRKKYVDLDISNYFSKFRIGALVRSRRNKNPRRCDFQTIPFGPSLSIFQSNRSKCAFALPYAHLDECLEIQPQQLRMLERGFVEHYKQKYQYEEKGIRIRPTDTVVDCGAFVGGVTVAAVSLHAERVISVEPSPKNLRCLKINVLGKQLEGRVEVCEGGMGESDTELYLNLSKTGVDDSFLSPDTGECVGQFLTPVFSLASLIKRYDIDCRDLFFKVEAEGFELEILRGVLGLRGSSLPRVIVVDVSPERDGLSPRAECEEILRGCGYSQIEHKRNCLFATH
jgi:FkbM family methyltransferase